MGRAYRERNMVKRVKQVDKDNYENLEFGDIIRINFSPAKGHEQKGYRPGLVISDPVTQRELNGLVTVAPITSSTSSFFTRVNLDGGKTQTKGDILVDQLRVLDLSVREYKFVEQAPKEILNKCYTIFSAIYEKLLEA